MAVPHGRLTLSTLLLTLLLQGCQSRPNDVAHEMLEVYMDGITGQPGSSSAMLKSLDEQETRVDSLKGRVPDAFITRYRRLLTTTRLLITDKRDERATQQLTSFLQSVTGTPAPEGEKNLVIAAADAFSEEVFRLDMLLDGETDRNKVRARYAERLRARTRA